jgi:hypothetical protein
VEVFKFAVLWSVWTPQVQSRVLRDVLALQRLAVSSNTQLLVACDQVLGVKTTDDFNDPGICKVYLLNDLEIPADLLPRLPRNIEAEVVSLYGQAVAPNELVIEEDPYAGVKLYDGVTRINETMPLDKKAPPHAPGQWLEPLYSPYL